MNIFYLDKDPALAARYHHNAHVVKMILETAQLLCTAHRLIDGEQYTELSKNGRKVKRWKLDNEHLEPNLYKATHVNHPSSIWARQTNNNYIWLYVLFIELCKEYTHRYGKIHKCQTLFTDVLCLAPEAIPTGHLTPMPQAMPDKYKSLDPVQGYRNYYIAEKLTQSKYTKRDWPEWIPNEKIPLEYRI